MISIHFSYLYLNNLSGTIPTEIGLMTSLQWLWEEKKKEDSSNLFYSFSFILVRFITTIWLEQFQLKLDWWLHWNGCEKKEKKRKKWTIHKNLISFFSFVLVFFLSTIWLEQFQLKLDWWLHWHNCEKKMKIHKNLFYSFIFFFWILFFLSF